MRYVQHVCITTVLRLPQRLVRVLPCCDAWREEGGRRARTDSCLAELSEPERRHENKQFESLPAGFTVTVTRKQSPVSFLAIQWGPRR